MSCRTLRIQNWGLTKSINGQFYHEDFKTMNCLLKQKKYEESYRYFIAVLQSLFCFILRRLLVFMTFAAIVKKDYQKAQPAVSFFYLRICSFDKTNRLRFAHIGNCPRPVGRLGEAVSTSPEKGQRCGRRCPYLVCFSTRFTALTQNN